MSNKNKNLKFKFKSFFSYYILVYIYKNLDFLVPLMILISSKLCIKEKDYETKKISVNFFKYVCN